MIKFKNSFVCIFKSIFKRFNDFLFKEDSIEKDLKRNYCKYSSYSQYKKHKKYY